MAKQYCIKNVTVGSLWLVSVNTISVRRTAMEECGSLPRHQYCRQKKDKQ
jgi:hypothetical protein